MRMPPASQELSGCLKLAGQLTARLDLHQLQQSTGYRRDLLNIGVAILVTTLPVWLRQRCPCQETDRQLATSVSISGIPSNRIRVLTPEVADDPRGFTRLSSGWHFRPKPSC
jgi:hypothetical protein